MEKTREHVIGQTVARVYRRSVLDGRQLTIVEYSEPHVIRTRLIRIWGQFEVWPIHADELTRINPSPLYLAAAYGQALHCSCLFIYNRMQWVVSNSNTDTSNMG